MNIRLRPVDESEFPSFQRIASRGFGNHVDSALIDERQKIVELDRTIAAYDGNDIVGTNLSSSLTMNIPGDALPVAGIAYISVQPTHRRQGILTSMMEFQLKNIHSRQEPLAALYSSESLIYGRFGFGIGTIQESWEIDKRHAQLLKPNTASGHVRFVDPNEMRSVFPDIQKNALSDRPGTIFTPDYEWDSKKNKAEESSADQAIPFNILYESTHGIEGYATYTNSGFDRRSTSSLEVSELLGTTTAAYTSLWDFCLGIDLVQKIKAVNQPADDPLFWQLSEPQKLRRTIYPDLSNALWIRLVDVKSALAARKYMTRDKLTLGVVDNFCPWNAGKYELSGTPDGSQCRLVNSSPDISLSVIDLASVYLGTVKFSTLAQAGRIEEHTYGSIHRADAMFATHSAPFCPFFF